MTSQLPRAGVFFSNQKQAILMQFGLLELFSFSSVAMSVFQAVKRKISRVWKVNVVNHHLVGEQGPPPVA